MRRVIVLKSFIKQIRLLIITMELTSSEENFTQSHWLIDEFESILSRNTVYLVISYLKFDPDKIPVEFIYIIGAVAYLA